MSSSSAAAGAGAAAALAAPRPKPSKYVCGSCGHCQELSQRDQVRCRVCGYRVFYKTRTERRKWLRLFACRFLSALLAWLGRAQPLPRAPPPPSPCPTRSRPIRRALASSTVIFPPVYSRRHERTREEDMLLARRPCVAKMLQPPQTVSSRDRPAGHAHASSHQLSDARALASAAAGGACACSLQPRPISSVALCGFAAIGGGATGALSCGHAGAPPRPLCRKRIHTAAVPARPRVPPLYRRARFY